MCHDKVNDFKCVVYCHKPHQIERQYVGTVLDKSWKRENAHMEIYCQLRKN